MFHVGDKVKARYNTPYTITTNVTKNRSCK